MDKITIEFPKSSENSFDFYKEEIKVVGYITLASQIVLANEYLDAYFNSGLKNIEDMFFCKWDYLGAENALMLAVLDKMTNISVFDKDGNVKNINSVVESGLWDLVKSEIKNYKQFRESLEILVENAKQEQLVSRSLGVVVDEFAQKLLIFINSLADIDISDGGLDKIAEKISELSKNLENTPLRPLLEEAKREKTR